MVSKSVFKLLLACLAAGFPAISAIAGGGAAVDTVVQIAKKLSDDAWEGRQSGTPGHAASREFLVAWLREKGFHPLGDQPDSYEQAYEGGINLIGVLHPRGTTEGAPTVLLTAHYDHLGSQCRAHSAAKSNFCNGAADNAGGVAAVLAAVEMIADRIETPVAVALWDNEESGMLGSAQFCRQPTFPLASLRLMINFDIVGLNMFKGMEQSHFAIAAGTGGQPLQDDVDAAAHGLDLRLHSFSYAFGHGRSDMTSFFRAEIPLPFVFFSDGDGTVYHSNADEFQRLNVEKIVAVATMAGRLALTASAGDKQPYTYTRPKALGPGVPPLFEDAAPMAELVATVLEHAAENGIPAEQVTQLEQDHAMLKEMLAGENRRIMRAQTNLLFGAAFHITGNSRALGAVP